ncbi:MAG: hypothetical protein HFE46_07370 [Clostridia bacterium]|jgi:hypothetical protein|nr:hypothetical protein [Clostridia bacterium]
MKRKKETQNDWDDGRVVAPMDGVGGRRAERRERIELSKEERKKITRAMFAVMLPRLLIVLLGFGIATCLVLLWLT